MPKGVKKRKFSAEKKEEILAYTEMNGYDASLMKYGVYSSSISAWKRAKKRAEVEKTATWAETPIVPRKKPRKKATKKKAPRKPKLAKNQNHVDGIATIDDGYLDHLDLHTSMDLAMKLLPRVQELVTYRKQTMKIIEERMDTEMLMQEKLLKAKLAGMISE